MCSVSKKGKNSPKKLAISTKKSQKRKHAITKNISDELIKRCNAILQQEFDDGYCIGDYLHRKRFLFTYEEKYGEEFNKNDDELDELLKSIGQVRDNRVYIANNNELLSILYNDVIQAFQNGASVVYYECLYEKYADRLATEMSIYSADSIRSLMQNDSNFSKEYNLTLKKITKYGRELNPRHELKTVLQNSHEPMTVDNIKAKLWYIPIDKIEYDLIQISDIVRVEESTYFYAPNFYISTEEKRTLITAIHSTIYSNGYLVSKNLREVFRDACPSASIDWEKFPDYAIRNILQVLLQDNFDFSHSVIAEKGNALDYGQIYRNYVMDREKISLTELEKLSEELGVRIYWDDIFHEMIRISEMELVHKNMIQFNVTEIDNKLEEMYSDDYTPLKDITSFLLLPDVSVRWNGFLLESYLRDYSKKFRLVQSGISKDDYLGVMLRTTSKLKTYDDVATDMLAKNNSWTDEKTALQLLVDMKLQKRATNNRISDIIKKAQQIRLNLQ